MLYKSRRKPDRLLLLEHLNKRMRLETKLRHHHYNLKKGYEGEVIFDQLTERISSDCLILNDLLLEFKNTTFQIDSLILTERKIYLFEIKYFEGNYYYENDNFYKQPKLEINNPLTQLSRSESLLRQLLLYYRSKLTIDASIVFIHPEFMLYQAPQDKPLIFAGQLNQYINTLNNTPSRLTKQHHNLAKQLVTAHLDESPYEQNIHYSYSDLQKGITCSHCDSFSIKIGRIYGVCQSCNHRELLSKTILRMTKEFKLLFPEERVTTNSIQDWCKIIPSKKLIRRVLQEHFSMVGVRQWTYYI